MNVKVENLRKIEKEGSKLIGVAKVVINDVLVIDDIKVIQMEAGKFIAMPSRKVKDTYKDVAHPTTIECREEISNAVLKTYDEEVYEQGETENMEITDLHVSKLQNTEGLIAVASVLFNDCFVVHDIKVIKESEDNKDRYKFHFPAKDFGEGNMRNVVYPINKEFADKIYRAVFEKVMNS